MENELVLVAAGIIKNAEGKLLITQRKSDAKNEPDRWEFPGGKIEKHESPEECLSREIKEELDIEIIIKEQFATHQHSYKNGVDVVLFFYLATFFRGVLKHIHVQNAVWVSYDELTKYDFAEADLPIVKELIFSRP